MIKELLISFFLLISLSSKSQVRFQGYCLDFEDKSSINTRISLEGNDGRTYLTYTNKIGFFKFDSIARGKYKITVSPEHDSIIYDTTISVNHNGDSLNWRTQRTYCTIIREDYLIDTNTHQDIYMLYTDNGVLHGDGFPQVRRLFKIIPIPFLIVSCSTYDVSGGSVERNSNYIGNKTTKNTNFNKFRFWTHSDYNSFHDIYIKPENYNTINYNCIGGTLYWID